MSEVKPPLGQVHIKNYLSLRNVELPLRQLTVLVGPNASGKSNILNAMALFNSMMKSETPLRAAFIQNSLWAGEANQISFRLQAHIEAAQVVYRLELKADSDNPYFAEELSVSGQKVISIKNGEGTVLDEDGKNETKYKSNRLAMNSAGDYGHKPITNAFTEFIKGWKSYDFQPGYMRGPVAKFTELILGRTQELRDSPKLDHDGSTLQLLLTDWYENASDRFHRVSTSLAECTNLKIDHCQVNGESQLCLLEGYGQPIPLERASDGTLRLVAYYILLNEPELPPLIAIEEPERNLHPGALADISNVLEQISERTQVIITTHSSQLLDAFNFENLSKSLGVLLLLNRPGNGTEVLNIEEIREDRDSLDGWISDFGIGSAIFESELLQDLMEETA